VAELLGVTPRTVHYYEEQGLVTPKRTDKGTRFYSDFDVRRLEVCVRLAELGVPIRTIARLAQTRPNSATGEDSSHALVEVFSEIRSTFRKRLAGLRYMLGDLEKTERLVRTCWNCPNKPTRQDCPDCPCEVELNSAFIVNLTWDPDRPEYEELPGPLSDGAAVAGQGEGTVVHERTERDALGAAGSVDNVDGSYYEDADGSSYDEDHDEYAVDDESAVDRGTPADGTVEAGPGGPAEHPAGNGAVPPRTPGRAPRRSNRAGPRTRS
jgi:DNA-binding transcriptional MerR regulator